MVPMIGHDDEVEGASFMPRAFCGGDDNALRKWEAGDLQVLAVDAEIGGGTFGEQQRSEICFARPIHACKIRTAATTYLPGLDVMFRQSVCTLEYFVRQVKLDTTCRICFINPVVLCIQVTPPCP